MSDLSELRCWNPFTGRRDGGYCVWEGKGKCMKCEAADEIARLKAELLDATIASATDEETIANLRALLDEVREDSLRSEGRENTLRDEIVRLEADLAVANETINGQDYAWKQLRALLDEVSCPRQGCEDGWIHSVDEWGAEKGRRCDWCERAGRSAEAS